MAESILYITFKDTTSSNQASYNIVVNNLRGQLLAAAERVKDDSDAIYAYLRQDSVAKKFEQIQNESAALMLGECLLAPPQPVAGPKVLFSEEEILNHIFKDLKRTRKSESIIRYLVQNSGAELTTDQLTAGAGLTKNDLSSWMAMTGQRIPAITRPSRGVYKFNPDKLII